MIFSMIINGLIDWLIDGAVEGWKQACKYALSAGAVTNGEWQVASTVIGKIAGLMIFVVMLSAGYGIVRAAIAGQFGKMWKIMGQAVLSWPLTLAALWIVIQVNTIASALTGKILSLDLTKPDQTFSLPDLSTNAAKTSFAAPLLVIFLLLIVLGSAVIIICMAARAFLIILAVALIPVGIMNVGFDMTFTHIKRYMSWIIGIIIYQPLVALMIYLTGTLMKTASSDNPITFVTAVVGMGAASIFPFAIIRKIMVILPAVRGGVNTAGQSGKQAVDTVKDTAGKVVGAGVQIAGMLATGGMSGVAGATGAAQGAAGASKASSASKPSVTPPSSTSGSSSASSASGGVSAPTATGGSGVSLGDRVKAGLSAAAGAMPPSPAARGVAAAINATSSSDSSNSASKPQSAGAPSVDVHVQPAKTQPAPVTVNVDK